jgi:hypothetical protein
MRHVLSKTRRHGGYAAMGLLVALLLLVPPAEAPDGTSDQLGVVPGIGSSDGTAAGTTGPAAPGATGPAAMPGRPGTRPSGSAAAGAVAAAAGESAPGAARSTLPCLPRPIVVGCKPGWDGRPNGGVTGHNVGKDRLVVLW